MTLPTMILHLFTEEHGAVREVEGFGYRPITLDPKQWDHGIAEATYPPQTFHFTGPLGAVHGWYVATGDGTQVQSRRCKPITIKSYGDKLTLDVTCSLRGLTA